MSVTPSESAASASRTWPDEDFPEGAVVECDRLTAPICEEYDYVVIGSGAAGAVAAHTLIAAGYSVAILEEGPWIKTRAFGEDVYGMFQRMMRDAGTQVMTGRSYIPLLQGRCVGGSTAINSAIAWRTPEDVVVDWSTRFGLGEAVTVGTLEPHFQALERDLSVRSVADDVLGENSALFLKATSGRGIEASAMRRYDRGCRGSARCLTGCPSAAKQGMNVSYVPQALAGGARIFTSCRADRVVVRKGRATGVIAHATTTIPHEATRTVVELRARRGVFVAASTIQTPNILYRSGIRSRALGRHFQTHPGVGLGGLFDRPINMSFGATQGAESIHFRKTERFKLETLAMPPELVAVRLPGIGANLLGRLGNLANTAVWVSQVRAEAEGTIRPGWGGGDRVRYSMTERDIARARTASALIAELFFDAGAREVYPGIFGVPQVIRSRDDIKKITEAPLDSRLYSFITSHMFGAARMGPDPRTSVVGLDFATHEARGLYVVDSSVFPTNLGVNPQHSIMAMSRLATTRVADAPLAAVA